MSTRSKHCRGDAPSDQLGEGGASPTRPLLVEPCEIADAAPWIEQRHYAHRMPGNIQYVFAAREGSDVVGVVTFGSAPTPAIQQHLAGDKWASFVLELNRLVCHPIPNLASRIVGSALRQLPRPRLVVSYADGGVGHIGYVYQATNWLYTGAVTAHDGEYLLGGKKIHARTLTANGITDPKRWARENGVTIIQPKPKHRYVFLVGDRRQQKEMRAALRYEILPYPKGETARAATNEPFHTQGTLL